MDDPTLSLVLFSGTDDKLNAAAVLAVGAAAMGRKVNVFLQYWALGAFRADASTRTTALRPRRGPTASPWSNGTKASTRANCSARPRRSAT